MKPKTLLTVFTSLLAMTFALWVCYILSMIILIVPIISTWILIVWLVIMFMAGCKTTEELKDDQEKKYYCFYMDNCAFQSGIDIDECSSENKCNFKQQIQ